MLSMSCQDPFRKAEVGDPRSLRFRIVIKRACTVEWLFMARHQSDGELLLMP
jgi:hypothetical protein